MSLTDTLALAVDAMTLDRAAFEDLDSGANRADAYWVAILAGASLLLGQSVALFVNRTRGRRFVLCLGISGVSYLIGIQVLAWCIAVAGMVLGVAEAGIVDVLPYAALAQAPLLFGFTALAPYFGPRLLNALEVWSFLVLTLAIDVALGIPLLRAAMVGGSGILLYHVVRISIGRPLRGIDRRLKRRAAGLRAEPSSEEILGALRVQARHMLDDRER